MLKEAWAAETDLQQRDPNDLNNHLKVSFEEVLGEPDHTHTADCVWKYSFKCFTLWKQLCYLIMTGLCGIIVAMCWGCYFACVTFCHVWCITPMIRDFEIQMAVVKKQMALCCSACFEPICESCGGLFRAFKKS